MQRPGVRGGCRPKTTADKLNKSSNVEHETDDACARRDEHC